MKQRNKKEEQECLLKLQNLYVKYLVINCKIDNKQIIFIHNKQIILTSLYQISANTI